MDITEITQQIKEQLLTDKEFRPQLYVEFGDGQLALLYFANFPFETLSEQRVGLFDWGQKFGQEHREKEIKQLCFFIEAWGVCPKPGEQRKDVRPSLDPDRFEMLSVQIIDVIPPKGEDAKPSLRQTGRIIEILRSSAGGIDLLPWKEETTMDNSPVEGFLAGFYSVKLSKKEWRDLKGAAVAAAVRLRGMSSVATKTKQKKKTRKK